MNQKLYKGGNKNDLCSLLPLKNGGGEISIKNGREKRR